MKTIYVLSLVALVGCCSNDWKPKVGEPWSVVLEKLGPPSEILDRDCYWRVTPSGGAVHYVRMDRWPIFKGLAVQYGNGSIEEHPIAEAVVEEHVFSTHPYDELAPANLAHW